MPAQPLGDGPTGPSRSQPPHLRFEPRDPAFLSDLVPYSISRGTRFAEYRHRKAPVDPAKLALLLEVCGYDVRRTDVLEIRGAQKRWLPAPPVLSTAPMPVLALLQYVSDRDLPARRMDPNDERLDRVFEIPPDAARA